MKKRITLTALLIGLISVTTFGQISNFFNSAADLEGWDGIQGDLNYENNMLKLDVTGDFWALIRYSLPDDATTFDWDFDNHRVICMQVKHVNQDGVKSGYLGVGFYNSNEPAPNPEWKMKNLQNIEEPINGSDQSIIILDLEDFPEISSTLVGIIPLTQVQILAEYVGPGTTIELRWIKSFKDLDEAYDFVDPIIAGGEIPNSIGYNVVDDFKVFGGNGFIEFNLEKDEMIQVLDIAGRCITQQTIGTGRINVNEGVYIVRAGNRTTKILVK